MLRSRGGGWNPMESVSSLGFGDDDLQTGETIAEKKEDPSYEELMSMFNASSLDVDISFHVDEPSDHDHSEFAPAAKAAKKTNLRTVDEDDSDDDVWAEGKSTKPSSPNRSISSRQVSSLAKQDVRTTNEKNEKKKKMLKLSMADLGLPTDRRVDPKVVDEAVKRWKKENVAKKKRASDDSSVKSSPRRTVSRGRSSMSAKSSSDPARSRSVGRNKSTRTSRTTSSASSDDKKRSKSTSRRTSSSGKHDSDEKSRTSRTSLESGSSESKNKKHSSERRRAPSVTRSSRTERGRAPSEANPGGERRARASSVTRAGEERRGRAPSVTRSGTERRGRASSVTRAPSDRQERRRASSVAAPSERGRSSAEERGRDRKREGSVTRGSRPRAGSVTRLEESSRRHSTDTGSRKQRRSQSVEPRQKSKSMATGPSQDPPVRKKSEESLENLFDKTHPHTRRSSVEGRSVATTSTGSSSRDSKSKIKMQMQQRTSLLRAPSGSLDVMAFGDEDDAPRRGRRSQAPERNISDDSWNISAFSESQSTPGKKGFGALFSRLGRNGNDSKASLNFTSDVSVQEKLQSVGVSDDMIQKLKEMGLDIVQA